MIFCAQKKKRATRLSNNTVRSQNPLLFVILTLNKKNVKDLYILSFRTFIHTPLLSQALLETTLKKYQNIRKTEAGTARTDGASNKGTAEKDDW